MTYRTPAAAIGAILDKHIGWQMHRGQMIDDLVAAFNGAVPIAESAATAHIEWRVETDQTEDDFGTDERGARDWLVHCENHPDWMPAVLMSRTVTVTTTPWAPATSAGAGTEAGDE